MSVLSSLKNMATSPVLPSLPPSPVTEDSATEPNTPRDPSIDELGRFAMLIPDNRSARLAINATVESGSSYHQQFIKEVMRDGRPVNAFEFSLSNLPEFAQIGWRIGCGRKSLKNWGVDLLLYTKDDSNAIEEQETVAGIHARFGWLKGGGGFFLIADNKRGKKVTLNGDILRHDQRIIPHQNSIVIGECLFTLQYKLRSAEEEEQFQVEVTEFFREVHHDDNPVVLRTPNENDSTFKDWTISRPISKGGYGVVYVVVHARTGKLGALKRIWKSQRNGTRVDREIEMTRRISSFAHKRIATVHEIHHIRGGPSEAEMARIRNCLDINWRPTASDISDEYIIISPLLSATFCSLYQSNVGTDGRDTFFSQLLDAVAFLHSKGISHRDIKPDNILVESYDPPKAILTDFGCASDESVILYDFPGTIPYLAPEQQEKKTHTYCVDYWGCGLVGLELTLQRTYGRRILSPEDLSACHRFLQDRGSATAICAGKMLQWEPKERMTAEEGLELLESLRLENPGKRKHC